MTSIGCVALESFSSNLFGIATEIDSFAKIKCLLKYRQTHRLSNTPKFFEIWILKKILKLKYVEKSNVAQSNVKSFYGRQEDLGLLYLPSVDISSEFPPLLVATVASLVVREQSRGKSCKHLPMCKLLSHVTFRTTLHNQM